MIRVSDPRGETGPETGTIACGYDTITALRLCIFTVLRFASCGAIGGAGA